MASSENRNPVRPFSIFESYTNFKLLSFEGQDEGKAVKGDILNYAMRMNLEQSVARQENLVEIEGPKVIYPKSDERGFRGDYGPEKNS